MGSCRGGAAMLPALCEKGLHLALSVAPASVAVMSALDLWSMAFVFLLVSLKTSTLQVVHGRLFGMVQSKANQWLHVLLPALLAAWRGLGDAPARSLAALAQRIGMAEATAAAVVAGPEPATAPPPVAPLVPMTGPNDASSAPKTLLNRRAVRAARKSATP